MAQVRRCVDPPMLLQFSVDTNNFEEDAKKVLQHVRPKWPSNEIAFKYFTEGITNKLVGCYLQNDKDGDVVLIRVNGEGTEAIIDRQAEVNTFQLLHANNCCPPLYALFDNGMAYGFVKGEPLDEVIVRDDKVAPLIAREMARLHAIQPDNLPPEQRQSQYRVKASAFLNNIPTSFQDEAMNSRFQLSIPRFTELQKELNEIVEELDSFNMPAVFSHNDLLLKNIVYNSKEETIHFIDFEYAFLNYQAFDIGNHFCEYAGVDEVDYSRYPDRDYQLKWLQNYLEADFKNKGKSGKVTDADIERLYVETNKCALAANFFWGLWALVQAKNSSIDFDFLGYAIARITEYFNRKKEFSKLKLPSV